LLRNRKIKTIQENWRILFAQQLDATGYLFSWRTRWWWLWWAL